MALGQLAGREQLEHLVGQVEQPQQVGDRDARAPDAPADLLAREAELLDEQRAGARLLDRVEVLAGHVLDQRELERLGVAVRAHDRGDPVEPGHLRRAPAPLAGDQLVRAARRRAGRAPAGARRARAASPPARRATPRRSPAAAAAGSARSARPAPRAAPGRAPRRRRRAPWRPGSPPGRGRCRAWAQPREATSLASSK